MGRIGPTKSHSRSPTNATRSPSKEPFYRNPQTPIQHRKRSPVRNYCWALTPPLGHPFEEAKGHLPVVSLLRCCDGGGVHHHVLFGLGFRVSGFTVKG